MDCNWSLDSFSSVVFPRVLRHSVMTPRAWDTQPTHPHTHLHTQSNNWCKTVHGAQSGTVKLLCVSRLSHDVIVLKEQASLGPSSIGATVTRGSKKLNLCDIPRGCVFLLLLRACGTGAGPGSRRQQAQPRGP